MLNIYGFIFETKRTFNESIKVRTAAKRKTTRGTPSPGETPYLPSGLVLPVKNRFNGRRKTVPRALPKIAS